MVSLEVIQNEVNELYKFRDHYFEMYPIEEAVNKTSNLKQRLEKTLSLIDQLDDERKKKAEYLLLKGRALNVMPTFDDQVEECLSRAVKLDPKLSDAWIQLGECYWKKGDVKSAHNCFTGSINHSRNKVALRSLSMVTRQLSKDDPNAWIKAIEESIELAKESVQLDLSDGTSWLVLGNAYLSLFFVKALDPNVLKLCFSAYKRAEADVITKMNPDLHYNRATLFQYEEDYEQALIGYDRASALDPTFDEAKSKEETLLKYLKNFSQMINSKGKMHGKKLRSMADSLNISADLGPFASGAAPKTSSGASVGLTPVSLDELLPGVNAGKVIVGKVVGSINVEDSVSFSFCSIDKNKNCFGVTVYNIAPGWGVKIGDSVAIPQPQHRQFDFKFKDQQFQFSSIRVNNPTYLVVNGRKIASSSLTPPSLSLLTKSE